MMPRHEALIAPYNPQRFAFADLPQPAKDAVMQYMHEGNIDDMDTWLLQFTYVLAELPVEAFKAAVMEDWDTRDGGYKSFAEYHAWYVGQGEPITDHGPSHWPAILSSWDGETLEDGWHRVHSYIRAGHATIPVLGLVWCS